MTLSDIIQFLRTGEVTTRTGRLLRAANNGNTGAQLKLGILHYTGQGASRQEGKAIRWFHPAAKQGNARAQFYMGCTRFAGYGIHKNYESAYAWFDVSLAQGCAEAKEWRSMVSREMTPEEIIEGNQLSLELTERISGVHCRTHVRLNRRFCNPFERKSTLRRCASRFLLP